MKKIIILFILFLSISLQAQWKVIDGNFKEDGVKNEKVEINVPPFKPLVKKDYKTDSRFNPTSINFDASDLELSSIKRNGTSIFAKGKLNVSAKNLKPQALAKLALSQLKEKTVYSDHITFESYSELIDDIGMNHIKYDQLYKGVPIYGGEIIVHINDKNQYIINGKLYQTEINTDTNPKKDIIQAEAIILDDLGGITSINDHMDIFSDVNDDIELYLYPSGNEMKLAYVQLIHKNLAERWKYIIDAQSGHIIDKHLAMCKLHGHDHSHDEKETNKSAIITEEKENLVLNGPIVSTARDLYNNNVSINTYEIGSNYYLIDAVKDMYDSGNSDLPDQPVGAIWTIDAFNTSPQNSNFSYDHIVSGSESFDNKNAGVSAHYNGGKAYEYFRDVHGRQSINGLGGNIVSLVNVADENGSSMGNAFWNGAGIFYGNGDASFNSLARSLDVAGHEMSHGVIQSTANLNYQNESGALNESFADIFGTLIEGKNWVVGEDVVKTSSFPSGALRSLIDPHNGAATGDYGRGWQPKKYSERYTGSEDNGGVHLNSGIPNHAFYLFANNSNVGTDKAGKVYYRALTTYLTKSSDFVDARKAIVQASEDLYGSTVVAAARSAFDQVEIFGEDGGDYEIDIETNPGSDLVLFTTEGQQGLYIADIDGNILFNGPITNQNPISPPSITDNGSEIIFVNENNELWYILLNWDSSTPTVENEFSLNNTTSWRNAVFSKDGLRLAAVRETLDNEVFVYDFPLGVGDNYELVNPTYTSGVTTDNVLYADAMEFDVSGEFLMYDAFNELDNNNGSNIDYWDISFIQVFDNQSNSFAPQKQIQKLFTNLEEDESVGNPTFSKNSPYIIAFDYLKGNEISVLGANTETNAVGELYSGIASPGYPNYSLDDDKVIFNATSDNIKIIANVSVDNDKINNSSGDAFLQLGFNDTGIKWGRWFGNGERVLSDVDEVISENITMFPNPAIDFLYVKSQYDNDLSYEVMSIDGKTISTGKVSSYDTQQIKVEGLTSGTYLIKLSTVEGSITKMFIKR